MHPQVILHSFGYLLQAAGTTLAVSLAGIVLGFLIGAAVCAARLSRRPWLERLGGVYVSVFRGVPLLVLLLFIYYFLAEYGLDIPALVAAVGGLALSRAPIRRRSCAARSTPCPAARARRRRRSASPGSTSGGASCCRRRCASRSRR